MRYVRTILLPHESLRFHRALYRFWSFQQLFGYGEGSSPNQSFYDFGNAWRERMMDEFLEQFSAVEIAEILNVSDFLGDIVQWVGVAGSPYLYGSGALST
jgi:hypothetical protein